MNPKYFFSPEGGRQILQASLLHRRPLVLLLDYDGTLTRIRKKPEQARLGAETRQLLNNLSRHPGIRLGLITGRSLKDISQLIGLKNIFYSANHGLEIKFKEQNWVHPSAKKRAPLIQELSRQLNSVLKPFQGVRVENKELTLSVHYRNLKGASPAELRKTVVRVLNSYPGRLILSEGKKVIEIKLRLNWDKGKAVLKALRMMGGDKRALVIYAGDDRTDEDAFQALDGIGLTIRVGKKRDTRARSYVKSPSELIRILKIIQREVEV